MKLSLSSRLKRLGASPDASAAIQALADRGFNIAIGRQGPDALWMTARRTTKSRPVSLVLGKHFQRTRDGFQALVPISVAAKRVRRQEGMPASFPFVCAAKYVGKILPGRAGGVISGCATPSKSKPKEGQYWLGPKLHPAFGRAVRKRIVSQRFYDAKRKNIRVQDDPLFIENMVDDYLQNPWHIPGPIGQELPYKPGTCKHCADHAIWGAEYQRAFREANEQASSAQEAHAMFMRHPRAEEWGAIEDAAVKKYRARRESRRRVSGFSHQREATRYRQEAIQTGMDLTSAEYRDEQKRRRTRG